MEYILDTNILLNLNEVILPSRAGIIYNILYTVKNEINHSTIKNTEKYDIIKDFIKRNHVSPVGYLNKMLDDDSKIDELKYINHKKYCFVTDNIELQKKVQELDFIVYNSSDFENIIKKNEILNKRILIWLKDHTKPILQGVLWPFILMSVIIIPIILAYIYPDIIHENWFFYLMIFIVPIGSYFIYMLRMKRRKLYGFIEIIIGILTIFFTIYSSKENVMLLIHSISDILKILAGFYIIIRGFDNFEKGIISPVYKKCWKNIFFYRKFNL